MTEISTPGVVSMELHQSSKMRKLSEELPLVRSVSTGQKEEEIAIQPPSLPEQPPRPHHPKKDTSISSSTNSSGSSRRGRLRTLKKLYGRVQEQEQLHSIYRQVVTGKTAQPNLVVVQGDAGVGKSALVNTLGETVKDENGLLLCWKFHEQDSLVEFDGFSDAFKDLSLQILEKDMDFQLEIRESILAAGPVNVALVHDMFPPMAPIIGGKESNIDIDGVEASGRHMEACSSFLRSLGGPRRPFVILFEDIHCSEACTRMFMEKLVTNVAFSDILFVVTVQSEKCNEEVAGMLQRFETANVTRTDIVLKELNEETVHQMVADLLHVERDVGLPMLQFVYNLSKGNCQFLFELLKSMHRTKALAYDEENRTWKTDDSKMRCICQCESYESLIQLKLQNLDPEVEEFLKIASLMGSRVDVNLILVILKEASLSAVEEAEALGILIPLDVHEGTYQFVSHGLVHAVASQLVQDSDRAALHLKIARKLQNSLGEEDMKKRTSLILSQLRMGERAMTSDEERRTVAALSLSAANEAVSWGSFPVAFECLEFGLSLLKNRCWRDDYDLSLSLHNTMAEVAYTVGAFKKVEEVVDATLSGARNLDDRIQAYCTKLNVLASATKMREALDLGLNVLKELGETIPSHPTTVRVMQEYCKTRLIMRNHSPEMILRLPQIADRKKLASLQIMALVITTAVWVRPRLGAVLMVRMMRTTVTFGLCAISSYAISLWGMFVCGIREDVELGQRMADVALEVLDRYDCKQWLPRVYIIVYGMIRPWKVGLLPNIEHLKRAYEVGLETGDIEIAMLNANVYCIFSFCSGKPLSEQKNEIEKCHEQMVSMNQQSMLVLLRPFLYMVSALLGQGTSTFNDSVESDELLDQNNEMMSPVTTAWLGFKHLFLSFLEGRTELAAKLATSILPLMGEFPFRMVDDVFFLLYCTIAILDGSRQSRTKTRKSLATARSVLTKVEVIAKLNPKFALCKLLFLKAEIAWLKGQRVNAESDFIAAIAIFDREKEYGSHAVACERAGYFMLEQREKERAIEYFAESITVYRKWGAVNKAEALKSTVEGMLDTAL